MRVLCVLLIAACGRESFLADGVEGGACYPNRTCNAGLYCTVDDLCLDPAKQAGGPCPESVCGAPTMVRITDLTTGPYWIDAYEASIVGLGEMGDDDQDADGDNKVADAIAAAAHAVSHGLVWDDDGGEETTILTTVAARSEVGRVPQAEVSFHQAAAACANAGKRLCTDAEWLWACTAGLLATPYPYGETSDGADEPGRDCWTSDLSAVAQPTGVATACVTPLGVYDLLGNVMELTGLSGSRISARGGDTNSVNPNCDRNTTYAPNDPESTVGFRCCAD